MKIAGGHGPPDTRAIERRAGKARRAAESATTAGTASSISYQPAAREMPPSAGSRWWRDGRGALRRTREVVA